MKYTITLLLLCLCWSAVQSQACSVNTNANGSITSNVKRVGQSITFANPAACSNGEFSAVRVLQTSNNTDLTLEIFQGAGDGGALLYRQSGINLSVVADADGLYTIPLQGGTGELAFNPTKTYTFVFSSALNISFGRSLPGADLYPNGTYYKSSQSDGSLSTQPSADLYLEVQTSAPPQLLPVVWQFFGAEARGRQVELSWSTSAERDNAGFTVEHSTDGRNWTDIGAVAPGPQGESQNDYRFTDGRPARGANYYRLRQTDYDGTFDHSSIKMVEMKGVYSDVRVFPNPVRAGASLQLQTDGDSPGGDFVLVDMMGRQHRVRVSGGGQIRLPDHYPAGRYFLRGIDNGFTTMIEVVK